MSTNQRHQMAMVYDLVVVNIYTPSRNFFQLEIANPAQKDDKPTKMNAGTVHGGTKLFMGHFLPNREVKQEIQNALSIFRELDNNSFGRFSQDKIQQRQAYCQDLKGVSLSWNHSLVRGEHSRFDQRGAATNLYWIDYPTNADLNDTDLRRWQKVEQWIHTAPLPGGIEIHDTCFRLTLYRP